MTTDASIYQSAKYTIYFTRSMPDYLTAHRYD